MSRYFPSQIEKKWQEKWLKEKIYEPSFAKASKGKPSFAKASKGKPSFAKASKGKPDLLRAKKPFYNLMMFPYPSAEGLHIGGVRTFTSIDMYGRFKRMQGYDVFEPIGLDGFGINSENYALKIGKHPALLARETEKNFYRQLGIMGNGFAWDERLETYDPDYYRWTQWIFVQMFKHGLAYRKKASVNWCSSCKTVLADEQVIAGACERCETVVIKKELEQWFFKITNYADRLLKNLEKIDWSEDVKIAQKNWIGKSEGALIKFEIRNQKSEINSKFQIPNSKHFVEVFTTRPDTLFGATYLVVAPEHEFLKNQELRIENQVEVIAYQKKTSLMAEIDRIAEGKEKTGVELKGVSAINPANNEEIPIWISDYVIASVGTGAIMAVPAHDKRDWEFAKKFNLKVRQVIWENNFEIRSYVMGIDDIVPFEKIGVVVKEKKEENYKVVIPEGKEIEFEKLIWEHMRLGFWNEYIGKETVFLFKMEDGKRERLVLSSETENQINYFAGILVKEIDKRPVGLWLTANDWYTDILVHTKTGALINSGKFNGMSSEEAKWTITKEVNGKKKTNFRLRDWLLSRQRYWGPPIPMIFCERCCKAGRGERKDMPGWYAVLEKNLPVKLPFIKDVHPTGTDKSPLASIEKFYKVRCPKCNQWARRETDVSDTFLDSAWYYLRYPSMRDNKHAWNPVITKKWFPVDMYIGGKEHSVLHLLYVRFLALALHDWKMVPFSEPFKKFRSHGLITKDGAKMSKSRGNVVNPDEYIAAYGADAMRMYLAFMAPLDQGGDFRDAGIAGITRFLNRVWKIANEKRKTKSEKQQPEIQNNELQKIIHKTIKKVGEDIENLQYNTAISALMILLNEFEANPDKVSREDVGIFLKLLAPFAPHITEELWQTQGFVSSKKHFRSIHVEQWPVYQKKFLREESREFVIQVNGKIRDTFVADVDITEKEAIELTGKREKIIMFLAGRDPKKIIFVPGRIVNIVV